MKRKIYVLDTSGIIGRFLSQKSPNITTNGVMKEVKDFESRIFTENALKNGDLEVCEPNEGALSNVQEVMETSGDVLRLSKVDLELVALAVTLQESYLPMVITDDYSMQNVLEIMKIPYRSVLTKGIEEIYRWVLICRGCKKIYPNDYKDPDCEICGSKLGKKRIKGHKN
ncbi:MAG TPA: ribonuclease VapC [Methanobacteriaceae archaeon]|nr:ribonuclease VapC [Methanobacteriaceae archaeon]